MVPATEDACWKFDEYNITCFTLGLGSQEKDEYHMIHKNHMLTYEKILCRFLGGRTSPLTNLSKKHTVQTRKTSTSFSQNHSLNNKIKIVKKDDIPSLVNLQKNDSEKDKEYATDSLEILAESTEHRMKIAEGGPAFINQPIERRKC